jgi:hypothetical protein
VTSAASRSEQVRARLTHPVIDADGHLVEFLPPIEDYVRRIGGSDYGVRFTTWGGGHGPQAVRARRETRSPWLSSWFVPTRNTLDRATAALPALLHERMDDLGLDFTVLFPSLTLDSGLGIEVFRRTNSSAVGGAWRPGADYFDRELRRVTRRAYNAYRADLCREFADRMTPVATLDLTTPADAVEDLEHAMCELGYKAVMISAVRRPIGAIHGRHPELFPQVSWVDHLGQDSDHDYDPLWRRCVELRVPVLCHHSAVGLAMHNSVDNSTFNRLGAFAAGAEAVCKSLFLGGVTGRFPELKIAFLECGVAWACRLYSELASHWRKRNLQALPALDPANLDRPLFQALHERYGGPLLRPYLAEVLRVGPSNEPEPVADLRALDDFAACGLRGVGELRERFAGSFFFGCELDDPQVALAFRCPELTGGGPLKVVVSSDIGHWDVEDMTEVLAEGWELVERGALGADDFRAFTFDNALELFAGSNPAFFDGTVVAAHARKWLASRPAPAEGTRHGPP